ncbi:MAG TPA: hypothetical protein VGU20_15355 [Stellaceae bacterium]|nr:hypothetical protein [Stellaceae bacterium]
MTTTVNEPARVAARSRTEYFYVYMAIACAVVAFLGFAPTYWLPLAEGTFKGVRPLVHIHGIVFFSWTLFFVLQTWLAASGRLRRHRAMGLLGISLATAMTLFGTMAAINLMASSAALGFAAEGKAFAIVPLGGILFFAITIAVAIANRRRPEVHQRLMLLAAISILDAAIARWFLTFLAPPGLAGPPPVFAGTPPALVALLLLVVAMVFDWRTRGRPHPVYWLGGGAYLALKLIEAPLSGSGAWHSIASAVLALAG